MVSTANIFILVLVLLLFCFYCFQTDEELDPEDIELDEPYTTSEATATMRKEPGVDEYPDISGITTARVSKQVVMLSDGLELIGRR